MKLLEWKSDVVLYPEEPCLDVAVDVAETLEAALARAAAEEGDGWSDGVLVARWWLLVREHNPDDQEEASDAEEYGTAGIVVACERTDPGAREFWHLTRHEQDPADVDDDAGPEVYCWACCNEIPQERDETNQEPLPGLEANGDQR